MSNNTPVLEVRNLKKYYEQSTSVIDSLLRRSTNPIQAVDDVSLTLERNSSQGVIGESGCGKTTLLETLIGLHDPTDGDIYYKGQPLAKFSKADWKEYRQNVQIIFQDPFNTLDPKMTIEESLMEPLRVHDVAQKEERIHRALERARLNPPSQYLQQKPDQLSGGEKQRVSIARALQLDPEVLLADEPVSMLDVSTQAAILELLSDLRDELDLSLLYISHDLSTVSYVCDAIHVMYLGRLVESGPTLDVIDDPKHPYAQALIDAIPIPNPHHDRDRVHIEGAALEADPGEITGCRFKNRCPERMDICDEEPKSVDVDEDWTTACHLYYDHEEVTMEPQEGQPASSEVRSDD